MNMLKITAGLVVLGFVSTAIFGAFQNSPTTKPTAFRTAEVFRGTLTVQVTATGTLEPEDLVDVGAQVAGRINRLGDDAQAPTQATGETPQPKSVDYGSTVEQNQILATIDDAIYRAQWAQANANLKRSQADLSQMKARMQQAEAEWKRAEKLRTHSVSGLIVDADYITAKSNYEAAKANLEVGDAVIAQAQAALDLAETNLAYTVIRSPVSGTIIDRRVNVGQTVIASLNAPSLFLIAKDLKRMQVWASVNEADIGLIKDGIPVKFTVDAFPDDVFDGQVEQIRLNASMTQNVVTYTVVISNDNSNLKLLPYLTADVKFVVKQKTDVLMVPNAALRYRPSAAHIAPGTSDTSPSPAEKGQKQGTIWVRQGDLAAPVTVSIGDSNDTETEISGEGVVEGLEVLVGEVQAAAAQEGVNPFAPPKIPKRNAKANKQ